MCLSQYIERMNDKADSSLSRMLSVLDLFSDQRLQWSAEDISEALQVSLPTGYRYVRMLTESGLLQHSADSQYTLGPRIIVLDHYIRQADPVLQHGIPFMKELVAQTGLDCVVSALLGQQLLDTHRELSQAPATTAHKPCSYYSNLRINSAPFGADQIMGGGNKARGISDSLAKSGEVQGARNQRHIRRRRAAPCIGVEAMPEAETGRDFGTGDGSFSSHVVAVFGGPNRESGTRNR